ncbi:SPOR domain-containing protein [Duncaniella muris]|uniref:SPOR domain-containing protein n=1 Tax=Duncaniella muris TaxID=2094150 RepID=UPI0026745A27|nr:SPOR domain-containing protein [Duncaniella muris]
MYRRFKFMRLLPVVAALTATLLTVSCKTSESNYRQAYETAVAKNREASGVDSTIYARIRNSAQTSDLIAGSDTLPMRTEYVGYTENGGASREMLKRYNVVVGQFKQKFNAREMRARLQANGYPDAFIIHTREPLYYVCTATSRPLRKPPRLLKR